MTKRLSVFTSESVTEGHPDKMADQISDAILDKIIEQDADARVACETMLNTGVCIVAGEITTSSYVDIPDVVRDVVLNIGYNDAALGFDGNTCGILVSIDKQSPDIAMGTKEADGAQQGAGDQGIMFGFATDETPSFMPAPIYYAHKLALNLAKLRKEKYPKLLGPDGKTQVSINYEDEKAVSIDTVLISTQHAADANMEELSHIVKTAIVDDLFPEDLANPDMRFLFNPTGRFVLGGPQADCGLTGRKIIVDTYGGMGRHGGGAFSGKDPSKVDRSATYMARYIAKNIVAAGLASKVEVQLSYAIGVAEPVSTRVDTFGTHTVDPVKIENSVKEIFDCKPKSIINTLGLKRPFFGKTAAYGHFGREDFEFPWEKTDKVNELKNFFG